MNIAILVALNLFLTGLCLIILLYRGKSGRLNSPLQLPDVLSQTITKQVEVFNKMIVAFNDASKEDANRSKQIIELLKRIEQHEQWGGRGSNGKQ